MVNMQHLSNSPNDLGTRPFEKAGSPNDRANGLVRCDCCWGPKYPAKACLYCAANKLPPSEEVWAYNPADFKPIGNEAYGSVDLAEAKRMGMAQVYGADQLPAAVDHSDNADAGMLAMYGMYGALTDRNMQAMYGTAADTSPLTEQEFSELQAAWKVRSETAESEWNAWKNRAMAAEAEVVEFREKVSTKAMQIAQLKDENGRLAEALQTALGKLESLEGALRTTPVTTARPTQDPVPVRTDRAWDDPVNWRMPGGIPNGLFGRR